MSLVAGVVGAAPEVSPLQVPHMVIELSWFRLTLEVDGNAIGKEEVYRRIIVLLTGRVL